MMSQVGRVEASATIAVVGDGSILPYARYDIKHNPSLRV